jgi:hypothetical protein
MEDEDGVSWAASRGCAFSARPPAKAKGESVDTRWIAFGEIEVSGERYEHDIVIDGGRVSKRVKKPSKPFRDRYGHTPLSADESIPWGGKQLIVGTGAYGSLPIVPEVLVEAERRGVEIVAVPTEQAVHLLRDTDVKDAYAILHITC